MVTKVDKKGFDFIVKHEAVVLEAYPDPATGGQPWTIGIGMTFYPNGKRVQKGDKITEQEAYDMFRKVLARFEKYVVNATRDDITQNQFNALVSFAYNCGDNNLGKSTLLKLVNKNPANPKIADEFAKWVYANGKIMPGLVRRRKQEADLYFTP